MQTFLFTDIEGSTSRWQEFPDKMPAALECHDSIIADSIRDHDGQIVKHTGDGFMAVFPDSGALACAADIQRRIFSADWSAVDNLRIRIGIHSGEASIRGDDYFGMAVNRAARIMSSAWGGQVVLSDAVLETDNPPEGTGLEDAGVHILKDLLEPQRLYILVVHDLPSEYPPLRTISVCSHNLPIQPTPFVGRKEELAEIGELLTRRDCRLLTLLAPGGTGKSRLALQAAAELIHDFRDGAFFVPLEDVSSEVRIIAAIASVLSLSFTGASSEESQLHEYLAEKGCLLVLDNFEHIVEHVPLVSRMLRQSGRIRILTTSRHRLNLKGEWIMEVGGMSVPGDAARLEDIDASSLFLQAALRADPSFCPDEDERGSIARICSLLEGSPLAIELAAAWVRMLTCSEIESELESGPDILETSAADAPERQSSLESVFEYSWKLMNAGEREALVSAAVFRGDFDRKAFEQVSGQGLRMIGRLLDMSLIRKTGKGRFQLHGLLRSYAEKKQDILPDGSEGIRHRHADYFHEYLTELISRSTGRGLIEELDSIEEDLENFRAAWNWSLDSLNLQYLAAFTKGMGQYSHKRSHSAEAREMMATGLARLRGHIFPDNDSRLAARGLEADFLDRLGLFESLTGMYTDSLRHHEEARDIACEAGRKKLVVRILNNLGNTCYRTSDYKGAARWWTEALEGTRELDQSSGTASILSNLAGISRLYGNMEEAMSRYREALSVAREMGDRFAEAGVLVNLGGLEDITGDVAAAEEHITMALELRREIGDRRGESIALSWLARIVERSDPARALLMHEESVRLSEETGDVHRQVHALENLCNLRLKMGDPEEALACLEEADVLLEKMNSPYLTGSCNLLRTKVLTKQERLPEALHSLLAFKQAYDEAGEVEDGFEVMFLLALALHVRGQLATGRDAMMHSLRSVDKEERVGDCPSSFLVASVLLLDKGERDMAALCYRASASREKFDPVIEEAAADLGQRLDLDEAEETDDNAADPAEILKSALILLDS